MNDLGTVELKILSLAREGHSRVEFKRGASKIICECVPCDGLDIYVNEGIADYTWFARIETPGTFTFTKADEDEDEEITESYRRKMEKLFPAAEPVCTSLSAGKLAAKLSIDTDKKGLMVFLREPRRPFTGAEKKRCETLSGIFAAAVSFRNTQAALKERIKELTCLYEITRIMRKIPGSIEGTLQEAIKKIPCAFQYNDIATSRIILDNKEYSCGCYTETPYSLKSDIIIGGAPRGHIEVMYKPEDIDLEEKPFLLEEQNLLDGIAKQLSLLIEEQEAAEEKKRLETQLRHADRLATIGQLAAGVAHEINEPLANILGFSELIKKDAGLSEQSVKDLDKIIRASIFARDTVKKLLVFASQIQPGETETNLNAIVTENIQFFEMRCKKENITVLADLDPALPAIHADPGQLNQVMINLFVNAMQAMPKGGTIRISTGLREEEIFLSIQDTGPGIAENIREKIFLPFFTTKEVGKGTGLGLAVTHGIVHAYKGRIDVQSSTEQGTNFTIYLPYRNKDGTKDDNSHH